MAEALNAPATAGWLLLVVAVPVNRFLVSVQRAYARAGGVRR